MKNLKHKILQEFLNSDIKIISQEKLEQYIEYCIFNNIKYETSHHHILPKSLFPQFSNLKDHPWNGVHLLYSKHYYAHWMITEAINSNSMMYAFCAMHRCDIENGRIEEKDLIPADKFQLMMEQTSKIHGMKMKGRTAWNKGKISPQLRIPVKDTSKMKIAQQNKAPVSEETKNKISHKLKALGIKPPMNDTIKKKISESKKNVPLSKDHRKKLSDNHWNSSGLNNPSAKIIHIFDNNDNLIYICEANFYEVCKENKLPSHLFRHSYLTNSKIIFKKRMSMKSRKFIGWYAQEVNS